jgi:hypothetical protein
MDNKGDELTSLNEMIDPNKKLGKPHKFLIQGQPKKDLQKPRHLHM